MQPYPRALDLVWPGHLHGTGCLSARAMDTGFPTVVWRLCLGPGCVWVWISVTPPALAGFLGGFVWVRFVVSPLFPPLGFAVFAVGVAFRPAPLLSWVGFWDVRPFASHTFHSCFDLCRAKEVSARTPNEHNGDNPNVLSKQPKRTQCMRVK